MATNNLVVLTLNVQSMVCPSENVWIHYTIVVISRVSQFQSGLIENVWIHYTIVVIDQGFSK